MSQQRFPELDFLRGLAVLLMILFHLIFDLHYFFGQDWIDYRHGFWYLEGRTAAILFMLVSGMTAAMMYYRKGIPSFRKTAGRAAKIALPALIITLVTIIWVPDAPILFGILHFFALSTLLAPLFFRFGYLNFLFALLFFWLGHLTASVIAPNGWYLPLGMLPSGFQTLDYYPLLPWFGVVLLGVGVGKFLYAKEPRLVFQRDFFTKPFELVGRHSLLVYLIHQPILLLILFAVFHA